MKTFLMLMMGGVGSRLGSDVPKQYIEVDGKPVFAYIMEKYDQLPCIDGIVLVSHHDWIDYVKDWVEKTGVKKVLVTAEGGETRSHSILNGLKAMRSFAAGDDCILIHDATHPYVDEEGTKGVIQGIVEYGGATLGEYQYDTVYRITDEDFIKNTLQRQEVVAGASPEGFRFGTLYDIYTQATQGALERMTSAGAIAIANGINMKVIPSNVVNLKITYKNDMEAFAKTVKSYFFED